MCRIIVNNIRANKITSSSETFTEGLFLAFPVLVSPVFPATFDVLVGGATFFAGDAGVAFFGGVGADFVFDSTCQNSINCKKLKYPKTGIYNI